MGFLVIYKIELTPADIEVIGLGLDELKFKVASPVAKNIQAQIDTQIAASKQPKPTNRRPS